MKNLRPIAQRSSLDVGSLFEVCETRLVLSAQVLTDVLLDTCVPVESDAPWTIEPQLAEAHEATGLDAVAEQYGLTGAGQTVAIIDSGIAWDHIALGEGYGPGYRVVGGWDFAEDDDQPYDDGPSGFHGTHISGVIGSDYEGNLGVAPEVDLVSLRVFNDVGEGQLDWVEDALRWVHENQNSFENPITTVNISIGTLWHGDDVPEWGTLEDELKQLYDSGIVVTASAGNSFADNPTEGLSYPATSQYVLPVASVDGDGLLSDFSQRGDGILAAPGSNITSSVPDHILGRDGQFDDFSSASGTSMASPYVAGATVLVRQAMEMSGWTDVNAEVITEHLHATADSIYDAVTGNSYDRLNLENAITSLLPTDEIGDSVATASIVSIDSMTTGGSIETWLNSTSDQDVFRFTATASGTLSLTPESQWLSAFEWSLQDVGQSSGNVDAGAEDLQTRQWEVVAGQQYTLSVSSTGEIGPVNFLVDFEANTSAGESGQGASNESGTTVGNGSVADLGVVDFYRSDVASGQTYSATAQTTGYMTLVWENTDLSEGSLEVVGSRSYSTGSWNSGVLRTDIEVVAGQTVEFALPGNMQDMGNLTIVNLVQDMGGQVSVDGTLGQEAYVVDLSSGIEVQIGGVAYSFDETLVEELTLDGYGNRDTLEVLGSTGIDRVYLRPGDVSLESGSLELRADGIESVSFESGGGTDRVYLYDSDADDVLRAYPRSAELVGASYEFHVSDVERIFIHAAGAGNDVAYLYDSEGDDELSTRPQFTSLKGDDFFNYVRGFERVYAYANAGGYDTAQLYDSELDDRFVTSGASASVVGPGFASYTRNFEDVHATASGGGTDVAILYGESANTQWQSGSDFVNFEQVDWAREARGFESVETYENQQLVVVSPQAIEVNSLQGVAPEGEAEVHTASLSDWTKPLDSVGSRQLPHNAVTLEDESEDRLHLPEERLLADIELERQALHAAFSRYGNET